jgi:hypothetical protein
VRRSPSRTGRELVNGDWTCSAAARPEAAVRPRGNAQAGDPHFTLARRARGRTGSGSMRTTLTPTSKRRERRNLTRSSILGSGWTQVGQTNPGLRQPGRSHGARRASLPFVAICLPQGPDARLGNYPKLEVQDGPGVDPANVGRKTPHGAILKIAPPTRSPGNPRRPPAWRLDNGSPGRPCKLSTPSEFLAAVAGPSSRCLLLRLCRSAALDSRCSCVFSARARPAYFARPAPSTPPT